MRTNYVLIDYENVQPSALSALDKEFFKVYVFVGANQAKVNFDVVEALQRLGANGAYIKISGNGPNALDFHIAYFIGKLAAEDESPFFHIISKDTGFDPLIAYLKANKIYACRSKSIHDIPIIKAANSTSLSERVSAVVANLKQRGNSRPRTPKTLASTVNSLFQKSLTESELSAGKGVRDISRGHFPRNRLRHRPRKASSPVNDAASPPDPSPARWPYRNRGPRCVCTCCAKALICMP